MGAGGSNKLKTMRNWMKPMLPGIVLALGLLGCGGATDKKEPAAAKGTSIQLDELLQPTDRFVVSSVPVTTIRPEKVSVEAKAVGTIGYDTRLINTISARVAGRIDRLYVRYRYQHIHAGDRIMDIYSPDLLTGEQELLFLLKNDPQNTALIDAARQRLLLLGVSQRQLQEVERSGRAAPDIAVYSRYTGHIHESGGAMAAGGASGPEMNASGMTAELPLKEGMYVEKGQTVLAEYGMDRAWVLLDLFPDQALVKKGDAVRVVPEAAPDRDFRGRIDFIEPVYREGKKTLTARVYFDNSGLQAPVGSPVTATIFPKPVAGDWLPRSAVLSLGLDEVVLLREDGGFRTHKIVTGIVWRDQVQVLSGLSAADSVAADAQYLMDSESFVKVNK
jgi:Cu(I)/Ag(I) efflux system membrane fusion protein